MKKFFSGIAAGMILGSGLLCFSGSAQALDANAAFQMLKTELQNKGLASTDIMAAAQPMKDLLGLGASSAEVKNVLLNFAANGFKGQDLNRLTAMVGDLMKSGLPAKAALEFVTKAIDQTKAGGLKEDGLVSKVQTMVAERKAQLELIKSQLAKTRKGLGPLFQSKN